MQIRRHRRRRVLLMAATSVAAAGLVGGTAVAASADPPALDPPSCTTTLARSHGWPGEIPTEDGLVPRFSDAYYSYLLTLPECQDRPGVTA
jgi:hypothetical protein